MLQCLIGMGIILAVTIVLAILHKKQRMVWVYTSVFFVASLIIGGFFYAKNITPFDFGNGKYLFSMNELEKHKSDNIENSKDYLSLVSCLLDEGEVSEAEILLKEYGENIEYSKDYLRLVADVYEADDLSYRAEAIRKSIGVKAKSGRKNAKKYDGTTEKAAKGYLAVRSLTDAEMNGDYLSYEEKSDYYSIIKEWADTNYQYSELPSLKKAQLAAELYLHNYVEIAKNVMDDPDGEELIVASQLIRNGSVQKKDIADRMLSKSERKAAKQLLEHIKKELKKKQDYSEQDIEYLNVNKETLENTISGNLSILDYMILKMEKSAEKDAETASKVYLELADIEYAKNNKAKASKYLEKALESAYQSSDAEYSEIVSDINDIMFRTNDPEARKDIQQYVERMEQNRMPENLPDVNTDFFDEVVKTEQNKHKDKDKDRDRDYGNRPSFDDDEDYYSNNSRYDDDDYYNSNNRYDDDEYDGYTDNDSDRNEGEETEEPDKTFTQNVTDSLNQMSGAVNILSINTDSFPDISAVVAADDNLVNDAESFKKLISVADTDSLIDDYTVEKLEYKTVNIILVCDDSGSMNGQKRDDLCEAVKSFVNIADDNIKIGMVPFSSGVNESMVASLGSSASVLENAADSLRADGGTNIYDAVKYANNMFPSTDTELNILILMSDGQDNLPSPDYLDAISAECLSRNISIYTVGLGYDVDANLLQTYSDYGNGTYFYVNSSESISDFYNFIFSLSKNRYRISYETVDTFQIDRTLEVVYDNSSTIRDIQAYTLFRNDLDGKVNEDNITVTVGDVVINGLKEKMLYPSEYEQEVTLLGAGFKKDASISVELKGAISYKCTAEYVDENTAKVTVPGKVATGLYDVYVTYNKRRAVFNSGLVVSGGDTNVIRFGEYIFTATNVNKSGNTVTMSGIVELNGWLGFSDKVTLTGDLEHGTIANMSYGKTYMQYTDTSAKGLSGYYAKKGYVSKLPVVGSLELYNDLTVDGSSEDYHVDTVPIDMYSVLDLLKLQNDRAGFSLYPDRAVINFDSFSSALPFQGKILSAVEADKIFHFSADADAKLIYSKDSIDCDIEVNVGNNKPKDDMTAIKVGNANVYANLGSFGLKLNTKEGEGSIKATTNIAMLADGVGLEVAMKDWKLDKIMFLCDTDINTVICEVPVTFSDFKLGVQDLSKIDIANDWTTIFKSELVGGCDASLAKVSALCPGIEKYIGDVSVLSFDDFELGLRLYEPRIRAQTKVKALGIAEIGSASIQLGFGLEYNNPLFVVQKAPNGFIGEVSRGLKIDEDNFLFDLTGKLNLALTDQAIGAWCNGNFHVKIGWWIFVAETRATGDVYLGFYRQHNDKMVFGVLGSGSADIGSGKFQVVWGEDDKPFSSHKF